MKALLFALGYVAILCASPRIAAQDIPSCESISAAVESYANCIDQAVKKLAKGIDSNDEVALKAVSTCREFRDTALHLKAVPALEPTVADFDALHIGLARNLTADVRGEPRQADQQR